MSLGERLKILREKNELTQTRAAELLDISNGQLSNYEKNLRKPDPSMLAKFCDFYNCSADYLLGRVEKPNLTKEDKELLDDLKSLPVEEIIFKYPLSLNGKNISQQEKISVLGFIKTLQEINDKYGDD